MAQQEPRSGFSLEDLETLAGHIGDSIQSFSEWLEVLLDRIQQFFQDLFGQPVSKVDPADMPDWLFREIACGSF